MNGRGLCRILDPMIEQFEKRAIRNYAERVAVPLFTYRGSSQDVEDFDEIGTGTLFSHASRLFLVTANHVLDGTAIERIVIPHRHEGKADLITLGNLRVTRPADTFLDVAVLEILGEKSGQKLRKGWTVITSDMVAECPEEGSCLLIGYPSDVRNRQPTTADVEHPPFAILTNRLLRPPEDAIDNQHREPILADVDLFFAHHSQGRDDDGSLKRLPRLRGMSGCTVWSYQPAEPAKLWTPETHLRAVGIQSGMIADSYIRAKSWRWAVHAIEKETASAS